MGKGKDGEREINSVKAKRREIQGQTSAPTRSNNLSKDKLKIIVKSSLEAAPTEEEQKRVSQQMKKRAGQGDNAESAKKVRREQDDQRREEAETAIVKQAYNKTIPLASNVRPVNAKPPHLFTNEWKIKGINRTAMVGLALRELQTRYDSDTLIAMSVLAPDGVSCIMNVTDMKKRMQEYEDCNICTCDPKKARGPQCKCKTAEVFKLRCTNVKEWKEIADK